MRIRSPLFLLTSFLVVMAGGWTSYSLFRLLARSITPPEIHKDTVLVRMIGGVPDGPAVAARPDSGYNRAAYQPPAPNAKNGADTSKSAYYAKPNNVRPLPSTIPIPADSVKNAIATGKLILARFP